LTERNVILIALALAVASAVAGALTRTTYARLFAFGVGTGLLVWLAGAILIFRGPDYDPRGIGEPGWTMVAGLVVAIWVGAWLAGAGAGRLLHGVLRERQHDVPEA
jgi:hypothetical protein